MTKVGIVGPHSSVENIMSVIKTMPIGDVEFTPLPYETTNESVDIVNANLPFYQGWLFSGPAPLLLCKRLIPPGAILAHCFHVGASLYRAIIQMSSQLNKAARRISFDMVKPDDISESLAELRIPSDQFSISYYDEDLDVDKITNFHIDAFKSGRSDGAVTSLHRVYTNLIAAGVPAYRNTPTKMEIRLAVQLILEQAATSYFKNTQVGLVIVELSLFDKIAQNRYTTYQLQKLELDIKRYVIELAEKLDGSLVERSRERYEIFSSRGTVGQNIGHIRSVVEQLEILTDAQTPAGIGFGETMYAAEINARRALYHARHNTTNLTIINDEGSIIEDADQKQALQYDYFSYDNALLDKLSAAGVNIKTYQKIQATVRQMPKDTFTVNHLADRMSVTGRNISRIIKGLASVDLVERVGEEAPAVRGRPSALYKLR